MLTQLSSKNGPLCLCCRFNFLPYTVELNYQATLLTTREEIGLVLLGPCGNILLFIILVLASFIIQKAVGMFPEVGSKLVISYGIQAFLDPFLILIVDCALKVCDVQWNLSSGDPWLGGGGADMNLHFGQYKYESPSWSILNKVGVCCTRKNKPPHIIY